jgi:hypothetical protein
MGLLVDRLSAPRYEREPYEALLTYLQAGVTWPVPDTQLVAKAAGLTRLIVGSAEYQFV